MTLRLKLVIAVAAWPAGVMLAVAYLVLSGYGFSCPTPEMCEVEFVDGTISHMTVAALLAFGPGLAAIVLWRRSRRVAR